MTTKREVERRVSTGELAAYLSAPFVRMIIPNVEEGGYLAEVLELPGCVTEGRTPEDAYRNLEDAMTGWIAASLDTGRPIPEPVGDREYSGHFPLRISTELHRAAALRAMQEGVSLNQWIGKAIAAQVAGDNLAEMLADQIAAKVIERMSVDVFTGIRLRMAGIRMGDSTPSEVWHGRVEPQIRDTAIGDTKTIAPLIANSAWERMNDDATKAGRKVIKNA
jgi:antitoxin HicB